MGEVSFGYWGNSLPQPRNQGCVYPGAAWVTGKSADNNPAVICNYRFISFHCSLVNFQYLTNYSSHSGMPDDPEILDL